MLKNKYSTEEFCELLNNAYTKELHKIIRKEEDPFRLSLMLKKGADPNFRDNLGRNVLFYNIREILMNYGANPWCQDKLGRTPLFYADSEYHAELLLDNLWCDNCDIRDKIEDKLPDGISWSKPLVEQIYLNQQDKDGCTALFHNDKLTKWLLERGIDTEIQDSEGKTALFYMNRNGTELLLKYGANPNVEDVNGDTPLFYSDCMEQTRALVNAGADIKHRNLSEELCIDHLGDSRTLTYLIILGISPAMEELSPILKRSRLLVQRTVRRWLAEKNGFEFV